MLLASENSPLSYPGTAVVTKEKGCVCLCISEKTCLSNGEKVIWPHLPQTAKGAHGIS